MLKKHQGARYHPTTWLVVTLPKLAVAASLKYAEDSSPPNPKTSDSFL